MDFINRAAAIWSKSATAFPFNFDPKNQKNVDRDGLWSICDGTKRVPSQSLNIPLTSLTADFPVPRKFPCPRSSDTDRAEM